ncbi:MAG: Mur ligase family protein, partial [Micrococcales bacterium]|nr:Mur ligase family protein [Micrococcales bacterium]
VAGKGRLSFFEVMWLLALVAMADTPAEVAVVEVGLGGLWDATNLGDSVVQVITPISRDHTEYLGQSLETIASEKAGIIHSQVVIGYQVDEVAAVLEAAVVCAGAQAYWLGQDFAAGERELAVGGQLVHLRGLTKSYSEMFLPLHGAYQADNAALALVATELLLGDAATGLNEDLVAEALADVSSPGRLEVVGVVPTVLVDAAHNFGGAEALAAAVQETFPFDLIGLVGVLRGKDAEAILGALEPVLKQVVITEVASDRAWPADDLAQIAVEVFGPDRVQVAAPLDQALALAIELAQIDADGSPAPLATGVLATGSVVLAGQVRTLLGEVG